MNLKVSSIRTFDLAAEALDIRFGCVTHTIALEIVNATQLTDQHIYIDLESDIRGLAEAIYGSIVAKQQVDASGDTASDGIEVITAFEYHDHAAITETLSEFDDKLVQFGETGG